MNGNKYACEKQAVHQDLYRQTETEDAREARLEIDRVNKELKREAETEDARTSRLQGQALRQQRTRDDITTSEAAEK